MLNNKNRAGVRGRLPYWARPVPVWQSMPTLNRNNSGFLIYAILPPQALNGLRFSTPYQQTSNTYSSFALADWHTSLDTTSTNGIRYTSSRRQGHVSQSRSGGDLDSSPLNLMNNLAVLGNILGSGVADLTYDGFIDLLVGESFKRQGRRKDSGASSQLAIRQ